jgi:mannosyl-3-phosphoglycerate phosphatase
MATRRQTVLFTDLDGTLLDGATYNYEPARNALYLLHSHGIPLVFCSSKTRAEQAVYRRKLGIEHPFIVEDGGAVFIPHTYFSFDFTYQKIIGDYYVVELGKPYPVIATALDRIEKQTGVELPGYRNTPLESVASITGLDLDAASLAAKREYEETVFTAPPPQSLETIERALNGQGLRLSRGGRFLSVSGPHDKGAAIKILSDFYRREYGNVHLVGIGDSYNDLAMFLAVDTAVLVQKEPGEWEALGAPNLIKVEGVGPVGWSRFVIDHLLR